MISQLHTQYITKKKHPKCYTIYQKEHC